MAEVFIMGLLTAVGFAIILTKISLEFFAKYHIQTDIAITTGLGFLFFGTFSGMATAAVASIFISLFLFFAHTIIKPV